MSPTARTPFSGFTPARALLGLVALLSLAAPALHAAVTVSDAVGSVQIRKSGAATWARVTGSGYVLGAGDEIKTGRGSRAVLLFDDGSKVDIGPNGSFALEEAKKSGASMRFNLGRMRAWVTKAMARKFQVRTPTAVCSVRGTEFGVDVAQGGNTNIAVFSGLVGVADSKGNEVLLSEGQKVDVTQAGISQKAQGTSEQGSEKTRQALKREVGLDMSKEEVQAAAAQEIKSAVYQEGKAIIDINGNRVRIEQYIIRPQPAQFKLVVLNERTDRFDYFYYLGTFNKTLPDDLSVALRQTQGQAFTAPEFFLTAYQTGRSNTTDSVVENATGGHLVDVNNNGDNTDNVAAFFDPGLDGAVRLNVPAVDNAANQAAPANDKYFATLYQNYAMAFNGVDHYKWAPAGGAPAFNAAVAAAGGTTGIQNYAGHIALANVVTCVGPLCATATGCTSGDKCTFEPQPGKAQLNTYFENNGGTIWDKFENYIISDEGKLADKSELPVSGPDRLTKLLQWNFQQIITASEFNGRKIDLAVSPRILIESGLIR